MRAGRSPSSSHDRRPVTTGCENGGKGFARTGIPPNSLAGKKAGPYIVTWFPV